jgi:hypothetical protein
LGAKRWKFEVNYRYSFRAACTGLHCTKLEYETALLLSLKEHTLLLVAVVEYHNICRMFDVPYKSSCDKGIKIIAV